MNTNRRSFLKTSATAGVVSVAVGAGLLTPRAVLAAWPKNAFEAKEVNAALNAAMGNSSLTESADINLKAPDIAENGAVVPITVTSKIPGTESISILIPNNATPLAANFNLSSNTEGYISTRVKMGKTSDVVAVVKAGGKLYSSKKEVKVTIGGCGG
ncbi:MAG: thiosulfate oxidation carrier protein SoxY [Gammaproteobacteria bacterium]|nr:thiosulfate oxidation carrier protein SoxY [Gammaproteobacteria bacterium]MCW8910403.1 thiosulfate oxidation carrier protein SoxY [Gammaproteobacteria bacterium]MCW9004257.1 thiosulfate oxidation carrier protein SoxY [Gammaproteobacteria bacterium]MCW9056660.1 thiosulfate oxidation carrier protein SoxY [Gammaproteobacteria bacterium]